MSQANDHMNNNNIKTDMLAHNAIHRLYLPWMCVTPFTIFDVVFSILSFIFSMHMAHNKVIFSSFATLFFCVCLVLVCKRVFDKLESIGIRMDRKKRMAETGKR